MSSPINKLEQSLRHACVHQRPADDEEMVKRWQVDEYSHLRERFFVLSIPSEYNNLVKSALIQWKEIESKVCAGLGLNSEEFLSEFEKAREDFLNRGANWQTTIASMYNHVYGSVLNMNWVNLFSWIFPKADKENIKDYKSIGRMVTAIFYIELLKRHGHDFENNDLKRIEARWRLVNDLPN